MHIDTRFTITEYDTAASIAQAREEGRVLAMQPGLLDAAHSPGHDRHFGTGTQHSHVRAQR
ncbi:MAG: hypothetical protein RLZZ227_2376 [Pseudomonadota bacterium]|jgi:hypothetical protein